MLATLGRSVGDVAVRALLRRVRMAALRVEVTILLAEAAHPVETVDAQLRFLRAELAAAKRGLGLMLADAALLQRRVVQRHAEAAKWQARAETALRAGDASLACGALARKLHAQRQAAQYADEQAEQQQALAQVQAAVARLEERVKDVRPVRAQAQRSAGVQAGSAARQRTALMTYAPSPAWQGQDALDARFAKFELDQAMDALRRSVQGGS